MDGGSSQGAGTDPTMRVLAAWVVGLAMCFIAAIGVILAMVAVVVGAGGLALLALALALSLWLGSGPAAYAIGRTKSLRWMPLYGLISFGALASGLVSFRI